MAVDFNIAGGPTTGRLGHRDRTKFLLAPMQPSRAALINLPIREAPVARPVTA